MHDKYDIEIRRITEKDIDIDFWTYDKDFDRINPGGTLKEYWLSDQQSLGLFQIFLLIEKKENVVIGILRIRSEFDDVKDELPIIQGQPAIYLSRIGVIPTRQDLHLGRILLEYLFYITKSEIKSHGLKNIWVYWRCRDDPKIISYYSFPGAKVINKYCGPWGPSVIMAIKITYLKNG